MRACSSHAQVTPGPSWKLHRRPRCLHNRHYSSPLGAARGLVSASSSSPGELRGLLSPASPLSLTTGDPGSAPTAHSEALSGQATHLVLTLWSLVHGQGGLWVFVEPGNVSSSRLLPESQEEGPKSTGSIQDSTGCVCTRLCV